MTITKKVENFTKKKGTEMTADERIEKLLNRFGQTISDLPKTTLEGHAYDFQHRINANTAAREWGHMARPMSDDYICHLCDVIDRLEIALETAIRLIPCEKCIDSEDYCDSSFCDFQIDDWNLSDVSEEDLNEEVYGGRK